MLKLPDGTVKVLVEGIQRANTHSIKDNGEHFVAEVTPVPPEAEAKPEIEALRRAVTQQFDQYVKLNKKIPPEILTSIAGIDDAGRLADTIAAHLPLKLENKQSVLDLFASTSGSRSCSSSSSTKSTSCRSKAHPRAASSARWRRASASTT
jgi:ATP-dependent Lon protease